MGPVTLRYRVCRLPMHPPTGWRRVFIRILGGILPKSDPDFFDEQESVSYWWLELDEARVAKREIGFASGGHPIRCAPVARNWGVFIGEKVNPAHLAEEISETAFEDSWRHAVDTLPIQWPAGNAR